jgi:disulfide bond formation protein DsbB
MSTSHASDRSMMAAGSTQRDTIWLWAALGTAVAALFGSLFLSVGLGLKACPLCFYQRAFVMSIVAVVGVGVLTSLSNARVLALFALPLAIAGFGVALFHVSLELRGKLECPGGIFGLGSAPQQSLVMFVAIVAFLLLQAVRPGQESLSRSSLACAAAFGAVMAIGSCIANPPMPEAPKQPYAKPPDICRPPFAG